MKWWLFGRSEPTQPIKIRPPIELAEKYSIGRDSRCDVVIGHASTSRVHCHLTIHKGSYRIRDASTNGTFVLRDGNWLQIYDSLVEEDDTIKLGHFETTLLEILFRISNVQSGHYDGVPRTSIFISHRRSDAKAITTLIADRIKAEFGKENVFFDLTSVKAGTDFELRIRRELEVSGVLIAIIGNRWLSEEKSRRAGRLVDNIRGSPVETVDYVLTELQGAAACQVPMLPVLVEGARIPTTLPSPIAALRTNNALSVREGQDFETDIGLLIAALREWVPKVEVVTPPSPPPRSADVLEQEARPSAAPTKVLPPDNSVEDAGTIEPEPQPPAEPRPLR